MSITAAALVASCASEQEQVAEEFVKLFITQTLLGPEAVTMHAGANLESQVTRKVPVLGQISWTLTSLFSHVKFLR